MAVSSVVEQGRITACVRLFFAFVVFGCVHIVLSQEATFDAPVRIANGCINFVMDKDVRKGLKLDDSQVAAIESMYIDVRETNGDLFRLLKGKTVDPVALSELSTKTGHLQEEFEEALLEILDPVQLRYLAGVCLRKEGILAVKYKVVAEALNVSRIQGEKIARIFRMSSLGVASAKSGKEAMEQVAAQAKKKSEDIKQVLSPEQLKDVSDLAGAK